MTRVMQMSPGSTHSYSHWLFIDFQPTPNADIMILITTTFFLFRERPTDSLCLGRFLWRRRFDSSKAIAFSYILARCIRICAFASMKIHVSARLIHMAPLWRKAHHGSHHELKTHINKLLQWPRHAPFFLEPTGRVFLSFFLLIWMFLLRLFLLSLEASAQLCK